MRRPTTWLPLLLIAAALAPVAAQEKPPAPDAPPGLAILAGRILTMAGDPIERGTILLRGLVWRLDRIITPWSG